LKYYFFILIVLILLRTSEIVLEQYNILIKIVLNGSSQYEGKSKNKSWTLRATANHNLMPA